MKLRFTLIFLLFGKLFYTQNISTDRPSNTDNSSTLNKGIFQVETGILKSNLYNLEPREVNYTLPTMLLRYGLSSKVEVRLLEEYNFLRLVSDTLHLNNPITGINSIQIGTKVQLFKKNESPFELSFLTHFNLPKFSKSAKSLENTTKLLASYKFNNSLSLGTSLFYGNDYLNNGNHNYNYSLILSKSIKTKFSIFLETYGTKTHSTKFLHSIDTGLAYLIKENFQLDFYFGSGLNHNVIFGSFGLSWYLKQKS